MTGFRASLNVFLNTFVSSMLFLSWNFIAKDKIVIKFCYTSVNFLTRLMCVWLMT